MWKNYSLCLLHYLVSGVPINNRHEVGWSKSIQQSILVIVFWDVCSCYHREHSLFTMLISALWLCWDRADGRIIFCLQWLQICWYLDNHSNIRCRSAARQLERRINHSTARHMAGKLWPYILRMISPVNSNPTRLRIDIFANMYTYYIHMKLCKDAAE